MKKWIVMLLAAVLALGTLSGCGGKDAQAPSGSAPGGASDSPRQEEPAAPSGQPEAELTLAEGEAKLIFAQGTYAVAAFHGPYKDIGAHFCDATRPLSTTTTTLPSRSPRLSRWSRTRWTSCFSPPPPPPAGTPS